MTRMPLAISMISAYHPLALPMAARSASASSIVGAMQPMNSLVTLISDRSRPSRSQWASSASSLRGISSTVPVRFDSSAYCATIRSVFFSPEPPIMIGIFDTGAGEFTASVTW